MGISLLSVLNTNQGIDLHANLDDKFVLEISADVYIDKFTVTYVVFGKNTKEICSDC